MEKVLISACLVGDNTKYNGGNNLTPSLSRLLEKYELVPFCSEVEGGLKTPRDPAEIKDGKVYTCTGRNVTNQYLKAAELAYNICLYLNIKVAILKECSPACGVHEIYDGSFNHKKIKGMGITASYLKQKGIKVYSENEIEELLKQPVKKDTVKKEVE